MQIQANPLITGPPPPKNTSSAITAKVNEKPESEKFSAKAPAHAAKDSASEAQGVSPVPATPATNETARTLFYAQQVASEAPPEDIKKNEAVENFLEYMSKSSTELWRERILSSLGLTEDSLAALPPEKRRAVEEKIEQIIRDEIEKSAKENAKKSEMKQITDGKHTSAENAGQTQSIDKNISNLQKLDPKVAQMAELPIETYHAYIESMQKFEEKDQNQKDV